MNKFRFALKGLGAVMFIFAITTLAQAQASRTWVSGVGDDVNPCSRTAPCKTFAGAISKTAAGGEISVLDPGGYGTLTTTKSITVDGGTGAGWGSTLAALTTGFIINALTTDVVTLRRLSINGNGNGINGVRIIAAKHVSIEECQIFGFGSTAANSGRGISDVRTAAGSTLSVTNTVIRNNAKNGIAVIGPILATIENVHVTRSTDAATAGIAIDSGAKATIKNSQSSINLGIGFFVGTAGSELNLENSVSAHNNIGVQSGGGIMRVSNSVISQNATGILGGVNVKTFQNNKVDGNPAGNAFTAGAQISQQ